MSYTIQIRRDLAANWALRNSVLASGEIGLETDTLKAKVGNGLTAWNSLSYWQPGGADSDNFVTSTFGRTGAVTAQTGDYTASQVTGAAFLVNSTDWINACQAPYSADPTGVLDSTTAIQNALNACPIGGVVYLPAGSYKTSAPLRIPPQVTLFGPHASGIDSTTCAIVPSSSFSGAAVILMVDQTTGGYAVPSNQQKLFNITLNCAAVPSGVDGIQAQGFVHGVVLENVQINAPTAHGIATVSNASGTAYSWRGRRVVANGCGTHGFSIAMTDCTWIDLEAINCGQYGFSLAAAPCNSHFIGCRAEWNGLSGFGLYGSWGSGTGSGGALFVSCSTDRNANNGVSIQATGTVPVTFEGLMCRRDGRNGGSGGGSYAGLNLNGSTIPVTVNGIAVFPGTDDNGSGTNSPQYGINYGSSSTFTIQGGYAQGNTAGLNNAGSNTSFSIIGVTPASGTTSAPTVSGSTVSLSESVAAGGLLTLINAVAAPTNPNLLITNSATGDSALGIDVAGDTNMRFQINAHGSMNWGPGNGATDVSLLRASASQMQTNALWQWLLSGSGSQAIETQVTGDTNPRWVLQAGGKMAWGPGNATQDTDLYRASAGLLQTDTGFNAQYVASAGLTGATAASRYVGATASGAPTSGTFAVGDYVVDQGGAIRVCTSPGTPGSWVQIPPRNLTTSNIQPDGTQAAGSLGTAADAGHVHPGLPWSLSDQGLLVCTVNDPTEAVSSQIMTAGSLYLVRINVRTNLTLTNIWFSVNTVGVGSSTGSFVGVYSSGGTLLSGSADIGSSLIAAGAKTIALTSAQALTAGSFYWIALLGNLATTQATLNKVSASSTIANLNLSAASFRVAVNGTSLTSLPASITPSSNTATGSFHWLFAGT